MKRLLLATLTAWLLLLLAPAAGFAQLASASMECCANTPICAGETATVLVTLEGKAPYTFRYSDGTNSHTVRTSDKLYTLQLRPATTRSYSLLSMEDASGSGQTCGTATVAVNQCTPTAASGKDCSQNCFDSKILEQKTAGSCTTYTLQVSNDGSCQSALSHFSISVPCGRVTEASNSRGWPMEIGTTDPTTGLTGIKVDNIKGFGENGKAGTFTVTYTICANSCGSSDAFCGFLVGYKAGTCVNYGTATPPYTPMKGSLAATPAKCHDQASGSVVLSLSGGKAPYSYQWSNGATTANLSNVTAGTYSVVITDAAKKQLSLSTQVQQPLKPLALQATTTAATCGTASGSIDLTVSGGTAPYSYAWSNGATTQDLSSLAAGTYTVTVADANNCSSTANYTLGTTSAIQLSLSGGTGGCISSAITSSVSGGTAPYSYRWNTGETSTSITPTTAGTYTLTVTDAAGCTATASTTTSSASAPIEIAYEYSSPSCSGGTDGWIDASISGGSGSYTYQWSNGSTSEDLENIASGAHDLTVTDSNGCTATARISLPYTQPIGIIVLETIQPDCLGNLGSITVSANSGSGTYTYTWSHGATGETIENLEPGYYTVTVTDDMGCKSSRTYQIKEPNAPQVEIGGGSCGNNTLTAAVSGGTGPYTYTWNTGDTSSSITGESGGYYSVIVTDSNGCTAEANIQLDEIGTALSLSTAATQPSCAGDTDGSIDLTVSGGTGSYTIVWSNGATTEDLSNVASGTYVVTVTDESGCVKTATVTVGNPAAIVVTATETMHANCFGPGAITVDAQNGTAPYTYTWTHGVIGNSLENLQPGQYTVVVTDANGCHTQQSFTIKDEPAPTVSILTSGTCSSQQLTAQVQGSTGPYTYAWSTGSTSSSLIPTISGSYSVVVTDANGCQTTAYTEVSLGESTIRASATVEPVSCSGNADGAATILASGGTAPYTYDWSNGLTASSANNLSAGVYSVRVTDARGCYDVVAFEIKPVAPLTISLVASSPSQCGQPNGSLSVAVTGGTAPYTYKWNTGATTPLLSGLTEGTYTIAVIDAIGCSAEKSFAVQGSTSGSTVVAELEECGSSVISAGSSAAISVSFEGQGPYTFSYTDGKTEQTVSTSENPYILIVSPSRTTTYTLTSVWSGCKEGMVFGSYTVTVVSPKTPVCTDGCFSTEMISAPSSTGSCTTYTLQVNAGNDCRYDLSHFNVALSCGTVSSMSNSGNWPMSVGQDPTTGLYSIKVDNIQGFGENESFTVTYTLCNTASCNDQSATCGPVVAYKAGQCVYYGQATPGTPVADTDGELGPGMSLKLYPNPVSAGQLLNVEIENLFVTATAYITISNLNGLQVYQQSQLVSPDANVIHLSTPSLPSGTYVVAVRLNNNHYTKQLFIY